MSKWRPSTECLYVIPDIHGQYHQLELILSRILPLRSIAGVRDKIIFLGDYIDRGQHSPEVLDRIIDLERDYPGQVIPIMGNHELMLLDVINDENNADAHSFWMRNGGASTLASYMKQKGNVDNPYNIPINRVRDYIPERHKAFMETRPYFFEYTGMHKDFIFVHGGCDPFRPLLAQGDSIVWDRTLYNLMFNIEDQEFGWDECIVTGHNGGKHTTKPIVYSKYMMLDCSGVGKLLVLELNSMEGFVATKGKNRLYKLEY